MSTEHELEPTRAYVPAGSFQPPTPQELTARLPNLEVTELLGHGGMGWFTRVGRAFDRQVAIKLVGPIEKSEDSQRFHAKPAAGQARTSQSDVRFYKADDHRYLVMEYVGEPASGSDREEGRNRTRRPRFRPKSAKPCNTRECGVIHCDVKPDNIWSIAAIGSPVHLAFPDC